MLWERRGLKKGWHEPRVTWNLRAKLGLKALTFDLWSVLKTHTHTHTHACKQYYFKTISGCLLLLGQGKTRIGLEVRLGLRFDSFLYHMPLYLQALTNIQWMGGWMHMDAHVNR